MGRESNYGYAGNEQIESGARRIQAEIDDVERSREGLVDGLGSGDSDAQLFLDTNLYPMVVPRTRNILGLARA